MRKKEIKKNNDSLLTLIMIRFKKHRACGDFHTMFDRIDINVSVISISK